MIRAEVGDIVTWRDPAGVTRIGRVAASIELPPDYAPARTVTVTTLEGDYPVETLSLRVLRPNFVQETWHALGYAGRPPWDVVDEALG
jgi:hypothetical protein